MSTAIELREGRLHDSGRRPERRGNENHHEARHVDSVCWRRLLESGRADLSGRVRTGVAAAASAGCGALRADGGAVEKGREGGKGQLLPGLLRDPGLPGSAGGSPGGNTRTIL